MKKHTLMMAVSAFALMMAAPAMAEMNSHNNQDKPYVETTTEAEVEANWEATKDAASEAWEDTKDTVSDAANAVSNSVANTANEAQAMLDTHTDIDAYVESDARATADDIIGKDIYQGEDKVAEISDVIINADGRISGVVVEYGGLMGVGERDVLVDVSTLTKTNNGYSTAMTEAQFDEQASFDDDAPMNGAYQLSELIDSEIVNPSMEEVAEVDDIVLENGVATKLILSYRDGVTSNRAMIDFSDADIVLDKDDDVSFKLSMNESAELRLYES